MPGTEDWDEEKGELEASLRGWRYLNAQTLTSDFVAMLLFDSHFMKL